MPPILLCWPTTSEADAGDMAVEVEPSRQLVVSFMMAFLTIGHFKSINNELERIWTE
jgi:hypothetical protein